MRADYLRIAEHILIWKTGQILREKENLGARCAAVGHGHWTWPSPGLLGEKMAGIHPPKSVVVSPLWILNVAIPCEISKRWILTGDGDFEIDSRKSLLRAVICKQWLGIKLFSNVTILLGCCAYLMKMSSLSKRTWMCWVMNGAAEMHVHSSRARPWASLRRTFPTVFQLLVRFTDVRMFVFSFD